MQAVEVRQQAEEHAAQASAADKRAAAAEQEAQLFEAQGKFADAAAAALQADRYVIHPLHGLVHLPYKLTGMSYSHLTICYRLFNCIIKDS